MKENTKIAIITTVIAIIVIIGIIVGGNLISNVNKEKVDKIKEDNAPKINQKDDKDKTAKTIDEVDYIKLAKEQLEKPKKGEKIAIIDVKDYGTIKVKFFPSEAPKAVENFIKLAQNGYYNGVTFHRVIDEFMIQGGDPTGTGTGGESAWKEPFAKEVDIKRFPIRGTLCMASVPGVEKSLGSQFFITQAHYNPEIENSLKLQGVAENVLKLYKEYGGSPNLFMQYTVFGQVFEGMDVVDKIAKVKTVERDKPEKDVVIKDIKIEEEK